MENTYEVAEVRAKAEETDNPILRMNLEMGLTIAETMNDPVFVKEGNALHVQERVR